MPGIPAPDATLTLTPTARLARAALRAHAASAARADAPNPIPTPLGAVPPDQEQTATPQPQDRVWLTPRILSLQTWLGELARSYFLLSDDARVLISSEQARTIWQNEVERAVFIGEPEVADLAERAWRLLHEHQLQRPWDWSPALLSPDAEHFQRWAHRYRQVCARQGWIDEWAFAAELPDHIAAGLIALPEVIRLIGFDRPLAPLQASVLAACAARGVRIERAETVPNKTSEQDAGSHSGSDLGPNRVLPLLAAATAETEIGAAARWARHYLETAPAARIAIVVPDLSARLSSVTRTLRATFDPAGARLAADATPCWHISLGLPLTEWPLIADALELLGLEPRRIPQSTLVRLLHSPFLQDADAEADVRARAALELMARAPWFTTANEAREIIAEAGADRCAALLLEWQTTREQDPQRAWPSDWAARFQYALSAFGFAQGRSLNSPEYQALARWHTVLENFSGLDATAPGPMSRNAALKRLRDQTRRVIFREENPGVPLEVLGVEEAIGSRFDAVWITTLDAHHWPPEPSRNPLIPLPVQARVPGASVAGAVAEASLALNALRATAPTLFGSFVRGDEQTPELPSALLGSVELAPDIPEPTPAPAEFAPAEVDAQAPPYTNMRANGGTRLLALQSACPFHAFAELRLGARAVESPQPGLDPRAQGTLLHRVLARIWARLESRDGLLACDAETLRQQLQLIAGQCVEELCADAHWRLSPAARQLEIERLAALVGRFLKLEREREPFVVIAREQPVSMSFSGITLEGRIDRIDALANGQPLLIDYKSGTASRTDWLPDARIVYPQLPAYAIAGSEAPYGIAFARVAGAEPGFEGIARDDLHIHGVKPVASARKFPDDWPTLLELWRERLEALAAGFASGHAAVDPRETNVCNFCHLGALCRVRERTSSFGDDGDASLEPDWGTSA